MPSNNDLITEAEVLAKELDISIDTDGMNNQKLSELVSDLKAKKKDAEEKALEAEVKKAVKVKKAPYEVAEGKALTTKRGIIGPGEAIESRDLAGGDKVFAAFVKSGHIKKN